MIICSEIQIVLNTIYSRALDKKEYLMIIFLFLIETYNVIAHLNRLDESHHEMVQRRGHNIRFYAELTKIIPNCHQILPHI